LSVPERRGSLQGGKERCLSLLAGGGLGTLAIVGSAITQEEGLLADVTDPLSIAFVKLLMAAALFALVGLPGFYARQAGRAGILGLAGFVMTFFGLMFADVVSTAEYAFVLPQAAATEEGRALISAGWPDSLPVMMSLPVTLIGVLLFGIGIVRANVLPRWVGWIFVSIIPVGIPLGFLHLGPLPIFLGFAAGGYILVRGLANPARSTGPGWQDTANQT
jgi:hypothetical protein